MSAHTKGRKAYRLINENLRPSKVTSNNCWIHITQCLINWRQTTVQYEQRRIQNPVKHLR